MYGCDWVELGKKGDRIWRIDRLKKLCFAVTRCERNPFKLGEKEGRKSTNRNSKKGEMPKMQVPKLGFRSYSFLPWSNSRDHLSHAARRFHHLKNFGERSNRFWMNFFRRMKFPIVRDPKKWWFLPKWRMTQSLWKAFPELPEVRPEAERGFASGSFVRMARASALLICLTNWLPADRQRDYGKNQISSTKICVH